MYDKEDLYENYVKPHVGELLNYAYRMTRDCFLSEDLVQEVIMATLEKFETIRKKDSVKWWMFKVLKNRFLDKKKKLSKLILVETKDIENNFKEFMRQKICLEDALVEEELKNEIDNIINKLPCHFKEIIILFEVIGFKYKEISVILDVPEGTVKSRLSRARKILESSLYKIAVREGIIKPNKNVEGLEGNAFL